MVHVNNHNVCRISLFLIWLILLIPVYTADALEITFDPGSGIVVDDLSARISWQTDDLSTGKVRYGIDESLTEREESTTPQREHSVAITGISSDTTFIFYIEARNSSGSVVRLPVEGEELYSFTTAPQRDRTPPHAVRSFAAPNIGRDSITLTWEDDVRDTDIATYRVYRDDVLVAGEVAARTYTDTGLAFSTEYAYKVSAVDASGNEGMNTTVRATTRSESYMELALSDFRAEALGTNIYVTWSTNIAAHTRVRYSQNALLLDQKKETPEFVTQHNITLTDLPANSAITLMAESCDEAGSCANTTAVTLNTTDRISLSLSVDGMDCNLATMSYSNSGRLDVKGRASPGADVDVFINGRRDRFKRITSTGEFIFSGVALDLSRTENDLHITAADHVSPNIECYEKILVDSQPPDVQFSNETEHLTFASQESVQIIGNLTDEHKVTLYVYLQSVDDTVPPPAPENVSNASIGQNSVRIVWGAYPAEVTDVYKYFVYRSDVADGPIAFTEPTVRDFTDSNVSTATTYTYQVSAIDMAGNEGSKSSPFTVTTLPNGTTVPPASKIIPPNPGMVLTKEYIPNNSTVQFTETITGLFQGRNTIRLKFVDEAGNIEERQIELDYDSEPPLIISPTSAEAGGYSPTYMTEVLIKGQVNKPAGEVWVWVNPGTASFTVTPSMIAADFSASIPEEPTMKLELGENGSFEAEVELSTSVGSAIASAFSGSSGAEGTEVEGSSSVSGVSTASGAGTTNRIVMVAVDGYGRVSAPLEIPIVYTPCSENLYWNVKLTEGGNVINTRELLEGVAAYGFGFELEWVGGGDASKARVQGAPHVTKATVGANELEKYDSDWITEPTVMCNPRNCTKGFVMINFLPMDPEGETYLEKELNLSSNRDGECWPGMPGGCIHLLLQMEITSDPSPLTAEYADDPGSIPVGMPPIGVQKQCIDLKIALDRRIDFASSEFVRSLLNASLEAINATLNFINIIEKPLKYAAQVTLGICLLTYISKFIVDLMKSYNCKWRSVASQAGQGGVGGLVNAARELADGRLETIASMDDDSERGACTVEYPGDDVEEIRNACKDCAGWIRKSKWVTDKWHMFCDRVMCPSVPSLQHYITQSYGRGGRPSLWTPQAGDGSEGEETPTAACQRFDPNTGGGGSPLSASCTCGTETCTAGQICDGTACVSVGGECTGQVSAGTCSYCTCGSRICTSGQLCDAGQCRGTSTGPCRGIVGCAVGSPEREQARALYDAGLQARRSGDFALAETKFREANAACQSTVAEREIAEVAACRAQPTSAGCQVTPPATTSHLVTDIHSESSYLPVYQAKQSGFSSITGMTVGEPGPHVQPEYNRVKPYAAGDWKVFKKAESDCEFAQLGSGNIKEMYEFNKKDGSYQEEAKKCTKGHVPQAACCPQEYMDEWGWGMFFTNEVKTSYCLSSPEDKQNCGTGQTIIRGVTGLCQPHSATPRAVPVILDGVRWANDRPVPNEERVDSKVLYVVDIDDKGSAKSVRRGYGSRTEVRGIEGAVEESGRAEISTGSYFEPESENLAQWFSVMDNSDPSQEEDVFDKGLKGFGDDISASIEAGDIIFTTKGDHNLREGAGYKGGPVETWYRQITGLLGDPGQQYIAQPAGSFMQSLLTLCLSGILSWIIQFKNMLLMLQQCFQTILVTGDGSSGSCQALISQYICDLIKEAISCIVQRLGGGSSARPGMGGIGGFFSSVADASRGITEEAQSRYGDRNLFSTTFAAENVFHDACVYAFTGEWPTDYGALFESAAYLPINSSGMITLPTRRWQAYDPNTGFSRYVYRISYAFFAGADLHFDLKLLCSGPGVSCEGGENGMCDCSQLSELSAYSRSGTVGAGGVEMAIPRHDTGNCPENGDLTQGQYCTDEILFVGPGTGALPLRFDKVVIDYRPTQQLGSGGYSGYGTPSGTGLGGSMANPSAVTGRIEGTIRDIGGPPLGLCRFDIGVPAFRCGVEIPPLGFARFIGEPQLTKPANEPFMIGDSEIARVQIQQELPPDTASCSQDCDFTKYFVIKKIMNQNQGIVYPRAGKSEVGERLNSAGMHEFTVFASGQFPQHMAENDIGFEITEDMFAVRSVSESGATRRLGNLTSTNFLAGSILAADSVTPDYAVNITYDNSRLMFVGGSWDNEQRRFTQDTDLQECGIQPDMEEVAEGTNPEVECGGFTFRIRARSASTKKAPEGTLPSGWMLIVYPSATQTGGAELCPEDPQNWKMVLEIRDADSVGGSSYQMSTGPALDPDTNEPQSKEVAFQVLCRQSEARPETSALSQLRGTAVVTDDNDRDNRVYGMWTESDTLGPGEEIRVNEFEWADSAHPEQGFSINVVSTAQYGILNIDVGAMGLLPVEGTTAVEKEGVGPLPVCGSAPCVEDIDVVARVIKIRVSEGDPKFSFSGFSGISGLDVLGGGNEVILNREHPASDGGVVSLVRVGSADIPDGVDVHFKNYVETDDGFTVEFKTEPNALNDPVGFQFSTAGRFVATSAGVSIGGDAVQSCSGPGGAGLAVADIRSESSSLPVVRQTTPRLSGITGFVPLASISNGGANCPRLRDATYTGAVDGTKVHPAPDANVYVYDCGSRRYVWTYEDGAVAANVVYQNRYDNSYYRTDSGGITISGSGTTDRTAAIAAMTGTPEATATPTPETKAPTTPRASTGTGLPEGRSSCFSASASSVSVRTLGSGWTTMIVSGATRESGSVAMGMDDAGGSIVLTPSRPEAYGVRAENLLDGSITLSDINVASGSITFNYVAQTSSSAPEIVIELLPMELATQSSTQVLVSGIAAALPACSASDFVHDCVDLLGDRIKLMISSQSGASKNIRITSLSSADNDCAGKSAGASCNSNQGTCWEPAVASSVSGSGLRCYTGCRRAFVQQQSSLTSIPSETGFCISSGGTCSDAQLNEQSGLCPSGKVCCPNGQGSEPVTRTPGRRGESAQEGEGGVGTPSGGSNAGCGTLTTIRSGYQCLPSDASACASEPFVFSAANPATQFRCNDGLVCCMASSTGVEGIVCGESSSESALDIATPTCKSDCSRGAEFIPGRRRCAQGFTCCTSKVDCIGYAEEWGVYFRERPRIRISVTNPEGYIAQQDCDYSNDENPSFCVPGVTTNSNSDYFGQCVSLFNSVEGRNKYCPQIRREQCPRCGDARVVSLLSNCQGNTLPDYCWFSYYVDAYTSDRWPADTFYREYRNEVNCLRAKTGSVGPDQTKGVDCSSSDMNCVVAKNSGTYSGKALTIGSVDFQRALCTRYGQSIEFFNGLSQVVRLDACRNCCSRGVELPSTANCEGFTCSS